MKRVIRLLSIMVSILLISIIVIPTSANAAQKATLSSNGEYINIGPQRYQYIYIENKIPGAKYTYSSSNAKIVKVNDKGELTGIKAGKAKITVKQVYKKKTTTVGVFSVTVVKPDIVHMGPWLVLGNKELFKEYNSTVYDLFYIEYANPKAKYTFYSSDTKKLVINKDGKIIETKKTGNVDIIVKETYNKKTTTVGKVPVDVKAPELSVSKEGMNIGIGESFNINDCYQYYAGKYYVVTKDQDDDDANDPLRFQYGDDGKWNGEIKGVTEGKMTVYFYTGTKAKEENLIGSFVVNVAHIQAKKIDTVDAMTYYLDEEVDDIVFEVEPYNFTDTPIVTSLDPSIVSIHEGNKFEPRNGYQFITLNLHKKGSTTIKIQIGSLTEEIAVTVE